MTSKFEKIHNCKKSHNKIVMIERDILGNTYCGYCHERVDYREMIENDLVSYWS